MTSNINILHKAFTQDGSLRQGYGFNENGDLVVTAPSSIGKNMLLSNSFDDNCLSQEELQQKIQAIQNKWQKDIKGIIEISSDKIDQSFQKLNPTDRKILAAYLKTIKLDKYDYQFNAEKEANYFSIVRKSIPPEIYSTLEPVLAREPHSIPPLLKLFEAGKFEIAEVLIQTQASRKLIRALVDRLQNPSFDQLAQIVRDLLKNAPANSPSLSLWLTTLIKRQALTSLYANHPELLKKSLNRDLSKYEDSYLNCLVQNPGFLEKNLDLINEFESVHTPWVSNYIMTKAIGTPVEKIKADFFISLKTRESIEKAFNFLKDRDWHWLIILDIYKNDLDAVIKLVEGEPHRQIQFFIPHLKKMNLEREYFLQLCQAKWNLLACYGYLLKKNHSVPYERFMLWARTLIPGTEPDENHPYFRALKQIMYHFLVHPERTEAFLEFVGKDPSLAKRLLASEVDVATFKEAWQQNMFFDVLKERQWSIDHLKQIYKILLSNTEEICTKFISFRKENPELFLTLLAKSKDPENAESFHRLVNGAHEYPAIRHGLAQVINRDMIYKGQSGKVFLGELADDLERFKGDMGLAFKVFARCNLALIYHITNTKKWNTKSLVNFFEKYEKIDPNRTQKIADSVCRLVSVDQFVIVNEVLKVLDDQQIDLAELIIDLTFSAKCQVARSLMQLRQSQESYDQKLLKSAPKLKTETLENLLMLKSEPEWVQTVSSWPEVLKEKESFINAMAQLTPDERQSVYRSRSKIFDQLIQQGNYLLYRKLVGSSEYAIDPFKDLNFANPIVQQLVSQYLELKTICSDPVLLTYSRKLIQEHPDENTVTILAKISLLVSDGIPVDKPLDKQIDLVFAKHVRDKLYNFDYLYGSWFTRVPKVYDKQAETLLCEGVADLLILKNNILNVGLIPYLLKSDQLSKYWKHARKVAPRLFKALNQVKDNPQITELITSVQKHSEWPKSFGDFMREGTELKDQPVSNTHLQKFVLAAFLMHLRQDDVGSCFATNVSIQIQEKHPLQMLKDLKEIVESAQLTRGRPYPLSLPTYILKVNPSHENRLLQTWDFTIANTTIYCEVMIDKLSSALKTILQARMKKMDEKKSNDIVNLIVDRAKASYQFLFDPNASAAHSTDHHSRKGTFQLHFYDSEKQQNTKTHTISEFRSSLITLVSNLMNESSEDTQEYLSHLLNEIWELKIDKKIEQYLRGTDPNLSEEKLARKRNLINFLEMYGGYSSPVLSTYFQTKEDLREKTEFYTVEELFTYLMDLNNSVPESAVFVFEQTMHATSVLKKDPTIANYRVKEGLTPTNVRSEPVKKYWSTIWDALKSQLTEGEDFSKLKNVLKPVDDETLGQFFDRLPAHLELVTGNCLIINSILLHIDTSLMSNTEIGKKVPFVHLVDTNWGRATPILNRFIGSLGDADTHFGFGYSPITGKLQTYTLSSDEMSIQAMDFKYWFKKCESIFVFK